VIYLSFGACHLLFPVHPIWVYVMIMCRDGALNMYPAYISIGSNMGQRMVNCRRGIDSLVTDGQSVLAATSAFYRTSPVDYMDQEWFVNAVVKIETALEPIDLLDLLGNIEKVAGRVRNPIRFGPRVLDMDIILYADYVMESERLTIPHPRMHKRRFVLQPICDIDATIKHPILGQDMRTLLDRLGDEDQKVVEIK